MKHIAILGVVAAFFATPSAACPWSGGTVHGKYMSFWIDIQVNDGCTQTVITTSGGAGFLKPDKPETFALAPSEKGWVADANGADVILEENGKYIWVDGPALRKRLLAYDGTHR